MAKVIMLNSMAGYVAPVRPLGAHLMASHIDQHYPTIVIDFCSDIPTNSLVEIIKKHIEADTICIGVSSTFWQSEYQDHEISPKEPQWVIDLRNHETVKRWNLPWVLGGPNSGGPFITEWDATFGGYSEVPFLKYLNSKSGIPDAPAPDFDIHCDVVKYKALHIKPWEALGLETARGCSFKCKFCAFPLVGKKKGTYIRNAESIVAEMLTNYEQYGTTKYYIVDDTFNETVDKIDNFCDAVEKLPFNIEWSCFLRLDLVSRFKGSLERMTDNGLRSAFFGVESFHPQASAVVGKAFSGKEGKQTLEWIHKNFGDNFNYQMGLIAGLPGESEESWRDTQKWCMDNPVPSWYWQPLNFKPEQLYRSEFDMNSHKYGYTLFRNKQGLTRWTAPWTTSARAEEVCREMNAEGLERQLLSHSWLFDAANTDNGNILELMKTPAVTIHRNPRIIRKSSQVRRYISECLS